MAELGPTPFAYLTPGSRWLPRGEGWLSISKRLGVSRREVAASSISSMERRVIGRALADAVTLSCDIAVEQWPAPVRLFCWLTAAAGSWAAIIQAASAIA